MTDFSDSTFVVACDALTKICSQLSEDLGRQPTAEEIGELLTWSARECSEDLAADVVNRDLAVTVSGLGKRKRVGLKRGDLLAVPAGRGHSYAVVYLGRFGSLGEAVGIFTETHADSSLASGWAPTPRVRHPRFVDLDPVALGRWTVASSDSELAEGFLKPELFHDPADDLAGEGNLGEYGAAEDGDGNERLLGRDEAIELGLSDGSYRQSYSGDEFEKHLARCTSKVAKD